MVTLSDYLNYLSNQIVQARKEMDMHAIENAKMYANDEYLKYFKAPRFIMPTIKMDLPIKISELKKKTVIRLNIDKKVLLDDLNSGIDKIGKKHNLHLNHYTSRDLEKKEFATVINGLKRNDYRYVGNLNNSIKRIDLPQLNLTHTTPVLHRYNEFETLDNKKDKVINRELNELFSHAIKRHFVSKEKLEEVYISPDTHSLKESGDEKILLHLNVELVEESLQVKSMTDEHGKVYEEIIID